MGSAIGVKSKQGSRSGSCGWITSFLGMERPTPLPGLRLGAGHVWWPAPHSSSSPGPPLVDRASQPLDHNVDIPGLPGPVRRAQISQITWRGS